MSDKDGVQTEESAELARSLCQQAAQLHEQAEYAAARMLYERSLAIQTRIFGTMHPDTARSLHGLGQVQMRQGKDDQARELLEQALDIQEKALGPEHLDTAASLHTLGELMSNQGDPETGLDLVARAFIIRQLELGLEHADTLDSMTLMALMLAQQGEWETAQRTLAHALSICEPALGEYHRTTARVLNGLGRLCAADETTYALAQSHYERALSIYGRLLGPDHPQTALVLNNLAALLSEIEDDDAALPLLERSLTIHERVYGATDWRTSFVLMNLAGIYTKRGEHAAARLLLERALIIREKAWGARHPETLKSLRELVATLSHLHEQGDERALLASMTFYPCLTSLEIVTGKLDPAGATMPGAHLDPDKAARQLHRLVAKLESEMARPPLSAADQAQLEAAAELVRQADEFYERGEYASAALRLEEALSLQERLLGEHHLDHIELLKKLARTKERQGQHSAVLPLTQRFADIHVQVLGPDHPATALALSELMSRQTYEYGSVASRPLREKILQSMEDALGPDDPVVQLARLAVAGLGANLDDSAAGQESSSASRSERREEALATLSIEEKEPLAGLEEIDWHALEHAYGPADDVPILLRLLLSDDQQVRDGAWQELYGNIYHQGDLYQATSYAVPFLIRMLDSEEAPDKEGILSFLHAVASGGPWLSEDHTWMEPVLSEQGRDFQAEIEHARLYASRARQAVSEGLGAYLAHLNHPLPHVRTAASALLCAFPEHDTRVLPALAAQLEIEHDAGVKARLVQCLGLYLPRTLPSDEGDTYVEYLENLARSPETRKVRFAAAAALARISGDRTPPEAIEVLEHAIAHPDGLYAGREVEGGEPPFFADMVVEEVCAVLSHLSVESRIPILTRMLDRVARAGHAHHVAVLLLDSAFLGRGRMISYSGSPEVTEDAVSYGTVHPVAADGVEERIYPQAEEVIDAGALTPVQTKALHAVLDSPAVWSIRSNLLQLYGLPQSPAGPWGG